MFSHQLFQSAPDRGQLAVNGEWEKALLFSRGEMQNESDVGDFLNGRQEVAFEAFFKNAFFGFRRIGDTEQLAHLIARSSQALASAISGKQFFEMISQVTNLPLGISFQFAEVGAVNAWRSVGPFPIKDPTAASLTFDTIWEKLSNSSVGHNITHPKAIEFAFDSGDQTNHWFALPISSDSPPFAISRDRLREALLLI